MPDPREKILTSGVTGRIRDGHLGQRWFTTGTFVAGRSEILTRPVSDVVVVDARRWSVACTHSVPRAKERRRT